MNIKILFTIIVTALLVGCIDSASVRYGDSGHHYKKGPPPHAPAHGYRHKHKNRDLIFDSGIGVYVVAHLTNHFYDNGLYFRLRDGNWEMSVSLDSGWKYADPYIVPKGLLDSKAHKGKSSKYKKEHRGKGKKK
ncbi:MAG: hypothetical protein COB23_00355 [Methylophaga sp.]|nr:MAG: hypothetical protein COB23_00355 [Methylophaga sp.]